MFVTFLSQDEEALSKSLQMASIPVRVVMLCIPPSLPAPAPPKLPLPHTLIPNPASILPADIYIIGISNPSSFT